MAEDKDIDLVLITGAGASREFGVHRPVPLMGDWSQFLLQKLWAGGPNYSELVGIEQGLSGEQFESALGEFLRRVVALRQIEPLVNATTSLVTTSGVPPYQIKEWYTRAKTDLDRIVDLVRESVFEQFNREEINVLKAAEAYGDLFERLHISSESRLVCATTNYDPVGELALGEIGRLPDCGEIPQNGSLALRTEGLLNGLPRYTPVLHLHGKVGWYRRPDDGQVYGTPTTVHQSGFGVPILMLPDPEKSYADDDVIMSIWSAFEGALRRAKRVLVLGHSLADSAMVRALKEHVEPRRLRITVLGDGEGRPDASASPIVRRIVATFPTSGVVPMRFGQESGYVADGLQEWEPL